jgi:hypothetical protein
MRISSTTLKSCGATSGVTSFAWLILSTSSGPPNTLAADMITHTAVATISPIHPPPLCPIVASPIK